jgi:hypothetical protein
MKDPVICHFDLALMSSYTGSKVELQECMGEGRPCLPFPLPATQTRPEGCLATGSPAISESPGRSI